MFEIDKIDFSNAGGELFWFFVGLVLLMIFILEPIADYFEKRKRK